MQVTVAHVAINMDQPALLWEGMHGVVWMYVLYGTGIVVFVSKCPERWGPGRFDYVFHSHQVCPPSLRLSERSVCPRLVAVLRMSLWCVGTLLASG